MGRRLNTYVTVGAVTYGPGDVPDDVAEQINAPGVFEDEDASGGYAAMKVDELRDELAKRGLPADGKKADLVAALEADDTK